MENIEKSPELSIGSKIPWNQWPGESDLWYIRFLLYRELGPNRTLKDAATKSLGRPVNCLSGAWTEASSQWSWVERAQAFDEHCTLQIAETAASFRLIAETAVTASLAQIATMIRDALREEGDNKSKLESIVFGSNRGIDCLAKIHKALHGEKAVIENTHQFKDFVAEFE
jgi:hypothetical protein